MSSSAVSARGITNGPEKFGVVAIGASAGGLDACTKLVAAWPSGSGMALVLVQHLDPNHESMMVELLARRTTLTVLQARQGMRLEREHLYVIPPGFFLSIAGNTLHLSPPPKPSNGPRLPFDFLLHSLAEACGPRAACVVLSGTGADGSLGLKVVKEKGGLVVVQEPGEAGYDGMPASAIQTGAVDRVLQASDMPGVLIKHDQHRMTGPEADEAGTEEPVADGGLSGIIDLLRAETAHDFSHYKHGTLQRQVERRMALAAIGQSEMDRYLALLRDDKRELDRLAKDLLINVTSFFRDREVFERLADAIVPELIRDHTPGQPLRVWVAGCSTGEEPYSLAMLFLEQIGKAAQAIKLQMFASDVDADAVAQAREGHYPENITESVSPARLSRFFSKVEHGYCVSARLREVVVFMTHDVLAEPPFSRLDLVSCRNLLIYLQPEAQAKLMSRFHFALRQGGVLLLGKAETIGKADGRFEVVSNEERLYRRVGPRQLGGLNLSKGAREDARPSLGVAAGQAPPRQTALAELCRRLVLQAYAPAAILINPAHECLFSLGPTDRYLRMASGHPTTDLLAMARPDLRSKLQSAIGQAQERNARVVVAGRMKQGGQRILCNIEVQPVAEGGEGLLLVCFTEAAEQKAGPLSLAAPQDDALVAELERELDATRTELEGAMRDLELSRERQMTINEEALSINEEYQATNEELLASKEELQSVNEEITALNSELQETLERQRTTSDDLQNILYSTDVATLFLDLDLKIRFFTPATKSLFSVIAGDVGRPLIDLKSLAPDDILEADARTVLHTLEPLEKEIQAKGGVWFRRRILPYRTHDRVEGVVITFTNVTSRKNILTALEAAKKEAERANAAKTRFLTAASHDLRQPLQTLSLLQGLLAKMVHGERAQGLVARLGETLSATTSMLNALLDIDQIETGLVSAKVIGFNIADLLARMRDDFAYQAQAQQLTLHVVPCDLSVLSDPRLLEQMIRNLLSNALKYTRHGKVLLGCRRRSGTLSIEVWDTGIGIPNAQLDTIFDEYHQLDNAARERSRGLGLGLSIVRRLAALLGHEVTVRSRPGKGSVFAVEVPLRPGGKVTDVRHPEIGRLDSRGDAAAPCRGTILVVEDDPGLRELTELLLRGEGHQVTAATDAAAALELVAHQAVAPDLLLADYNLPGELNGLQLAARLRETLGREIPIIILTGNISADVMQQATLKRCEHLNKPVKRQELMSTIQHLLGTARAFHQSDVQPNAARSDSTRQARIFVVDDDPRIRETMREVLEANGRAVETFATGEEFLDSYASGHDGCLLVDAYLPGLSGIELLQRFRAAGHHLPTIVFTGSSDVPMAVAAMKAGAADFIEKPIGGVELLASIERALEHFDDTAKLSSWREAAAKRIAELTPRQREIMTLVLAGHPSKNIAADLHISQRTVENHRADIMRKTGSSSLPALTRLALAANWHGTDHARGKRNVVDGQGGPVPTDFA